MFSPGDTLRPDEDDVTGLKRALNLKLAPTAEQLAADSSANTNSDWEVGDLLSVWWRPNFETYMVKTIIFFSLRVVY